MDRLSALGHPARGVSRSSSIPFDWDRKETWASALQGTDRVYLVHPDITSPAAAGQIAAFSRQAVGAGAKRIVFLSGRGDDAVMSVENNVTSSGADWTVVRPGWFNQNFDEGFFLEAVKAGEIALPTGNAREAFVDANDIADVVVSALLDEGHVGKVYELSGPRSINFHEVAQELSKATGRNIIYTPLSLEEFRASLAAQGLPEEMADMYSGITGGASSHVVNGVQEAFGRQPIDFSEYATKTADTGVWNA
ncbi:NmrA family NAD(P)-binding protein [Agrobacterium fabrum]|uniref:NmrA family NAD(P)-binding protein n=1 Tax=Agrobacterium fabrum TaxID=1176649 RepID=UPI0021587444|nr:NmrA family NAD(P)-binding protein [Agrobacterium fabrum]MCR6727719.1 NAD(P)H-binding protein [Agrobacterium fabrum]